MADTLRAAGAMCGVLIAAGLVSRLCPWACDAGADSFALRGGDIGGLGVACGS